MMMWNARFRRVSRRRRFRMITLRVRTFLSLRRIIFIFVLVYLIIIDLLTIITDAIGSFGFITGKKCSSIGVTSAVGLDEVLGLNFSIMLFIIACIVFNWVASRS